MEEEFLESEVIFADDYINDMYKPDDLVPKSKKSNHSTKKKLNMKSSTKTTSTPIHIPEKNTCSISSARHRPNCINHELNVANLSNYESDNDDDESDQFEELDEAAVVINGEHGKIVPPHVIVAKRIAAKMATSVYGMSGRSHLHGKNLCQLRNSILRLTGFLET